VLTHIMNGAIEAHFHFFVMVTVLALYEDWAPFLASIGFVLLHHGLGSAFAHDSVFDHGGSPWVWAGLHTFFIAALSVANVVNWRAAEVIRDDLHKHATELEHSNAELERFAYVASHDLAEPLRMVTSYLQLIEKRVALDDETKQFLHFAVDGAARMRQLMDDLLRYSRAGRSTLHRRPVETDDIVAETMRSLAVALDEAAATVEVEPLPPIDADPVLIGQVFQNLISNAVKFRNGEPPVIHVSGTAIRGGWEFCVADNGIGIPPEESDRIFTMFERLHHAEEYDGTGIGLAVCQLIVERHGGHIRVEPVAEGHGSTFVFTLSEETAPA
jgi:light-regulated signal transduction histidine kinase (bacteriophytochrome)